MYKRQVQELGSHNNFKNTIPGLVGAYDSLRDSLSDLAPDLSQVYSAEQAGGAQSRYTQALAKLDGLKAENAMDAITKAQFAKLRRGPETSTWISEAYNERMRNTSFFVAWRMRCKSQRPLFPFGLCQLRLGRRELVLFRREHAFSLCPLFFK